MSDLRLSSIIYKIQDVPYALNVNVLFFNFYIMSSFVPIDT